MSTRQRVYARFLVVLLVTVAVAAVLVSAGPARADSVVSPSIWTDEQDYSPEETVTIYGSGFNASANIAASVTRPDSTIDPLSNVSSDDSGSFTTTYALDGIMGTYTVSATDGTNNQTTAFNVKVDTQTVVSCTPDSVPVSTGTTCSATVTSSSPPTGQTVSWGSTGSGTFDSISCTLDGSPAVCSVTYTPSDVGDGTHVVVANYVGDAAHLDSSGNFSLAVTGDLTETTTTTTTTTTSTTTTSGTTSIWTDREDYAPGDTPIINGAGFNPNANITVTVTRPDGEVNTWFVISDGSGNFTTPYALDGITGVYTVSATDGTNTATTTFTDASLSCSPDPTSVGTGVTCTATGVSGSGSNPDRPAHFEWFDASNVMQRSSATGSCSSSTCQDQYAPGSLGQWIVKLVKDLDSSVRASDKFSVKAYVFTVSISPTSAVPGETKTYTITITNDLTSSSGVVLGSARVAVPSGFTGTTIGTITCPSGKTWTATLDSGPPVRIELSATATGNKLDPGQSVSVSFSATAPGTAGTYEWTTSAWDRRDYSGISFTIKSGTSQPTVTISSVFSVTFDASPSHLSDVAATTTVLTVKTGGSDSSCTGGSEVSVEQQDLSKAFTGLAPNTWVCYSYLSPLASKSTAGKQYRWSSASGSGSAPTSPGQSGSFQLTQNSGVTATYTAGKLVFTVGTDQMLTVGQVSAQITVERQDEYGNPVTTGGSLIVELTTTSSGGAFYSDSTGTTLITSVSISDGASESSSFYYKDTDIGSPTLTASATDFTDATTTFTIVAAGNGAFNLDQCRNGKFTTYAAFLDNLATPCGTTGDQFWQNGNINAANSAYREGDGIPYRLRVTGLTPGPYTMTIQYDFSQKEQFAFDRLTGFDLTQKSDPCADNPDVSCTLAGVIYSPSDMPGEVETPSSTQPALPNGGNLFTFNGPTATPAHLNELANSRKLAAWISAGQSFTWGTMDYYVLQDGDYVSAGTKRSFSFRFTVENCPEAGCSVVFAWTGHVASSVPTTDGGWGPGLGAASISGSPFHMRVIGLCPGSPTTCTTGGNQDRSVSVGVVLETGTLTVVKNTEDGAGGPFVFATTGGDGLPSQFSLTTTSPSNTASQSFTLNIGAYTVSESSLPPGWIPTSAICSPSPNTPSSITISAGASVTCTFTNTFSPPPVIIETVVKDSSGATVTLPVPLGTAVYDTATLSGGLSPITGTVTYNLYTNGACSGSPSTTLGFPQTVTIGTGNSVPDSGSVTLPAGSYGFKAHYSGVDPNSPADSLCEPLTVTKASTTTATAIHQIVDTTHTVVTSVPLNSVVHDSASVGTQLGSFVISGTVTYNFYTGSACSDAPTWTEDKTMSGGSVPESSATAALAVGQYRFQAVYLGDDNYSGSTSPCEPLTVTKATPTVATEIHDGDHKVVTSVAFGSSVHDKATVTGITGFTPDSSKVTFTFYSGGTCSGTGTSVAYVDSDPTGGAMSDTVGPLTAGMWSFKAFFEGDSNYVAADSGCEPLEVTLAQSAITTTIKDAQDKTVTVVAVGTTVHDTASLPGVGSDATGTVTYQRYSTIDCTGSHVDEQVTVTGGTVPDSSPFTIASVAPISYMAVYSGDSNYSGAASVCEPLEVESGLPEVTVKSSYFGKADPAFTGLTVQVDRSPARETEFTVQVQPGVHKFTAPRTWRVNGVTFRFFSWKVDDCETGATISTRNTFKYNVESAKTFCAVYRAPMYTLKVYANDATTGKPIANVEVWLDTTKLGTTNSRGRLSVRVQADPFGTHTLTMKDPLLRYSDYTYPDPLNITGNRTVKIRLTP